MGFRPRPALGPNATVEPVVRGEDRSRASAVEARTGGRKHCPTPKRERAAEAERLPRPNEHQHTSGWPRSG